MWVCLRYSSYPKVSATAGLTLSHMLEDSSLPLPQEHKKASSVSQEKKCFSQDLVPLPSQLLGLVLRAKIQNGMV